MTSMVAELVLFILFSFSWRLFKGLTLQFLKWSGTQPSMWCEIGQFLGVTRRVADLAAYWTRQRAESGLRPRLSLTSMAGAVLIRQLLNSLSQSQTNSYNFAFGQNVPLIHVFHSLKHISLSFTCLHLVPSDLTLPPLTTSHLSLLQSSPCGKCLEVVISGHVKVYIGRDWKF